MRDRMERFVVLPFSIGCVSHSSVAVINNNGNSNSQPKKPQTGQPTKGEEKDLGGGGGKMVKNNPLGFLPLQRPNITAGLQRLMKSFKGLSQIFSYKGEDEEEEIKMEIGFPTDVQHVTHIGWDGSNSLSTMKKSSWDTAPELLSLPPISVRQFELAMAAQADPPHLVH